MSTIYCSAPGKVILSGEHAVVYGKPALVSSINLRLKFSLTDNDSLRQNKLTRNIALIAQKVKTYLISNEIAFKDRAFFYQIESDIPVGRGLGSSAALAAAAAYCFLIFYTGHEFGRDIVNSISYEIEKYFHQKPSGVDNSVACFGGLIYFRKEFEFLKTISSLQFKIPETISRGLYLIDTGKPFESTAEMVKTVGEKYNKNPHRLNQIFNDIEKKVKQMTISLVQENTDLFIESLEGNEILLEKLGVVSHKGKQILDKLRPVGTGKITGAGGKKQGSGYLLFYTRKKEDLEEYCHLYKVPYFKFSQSHKGVIRE